MKANCFYTQYKYAIKKLQDIFLFVYDVMVEFNANNLK